MTLLTRRCRPLLLATVFAAALIVQVQAQAQGMAWVSSEKDNTLTLIDTTTLTVAATLPTCKRPRHIQFAPDGKRLFVSCTDSNAADIIDPAARKSLGRLPMGEDPEAFDFSADGKTIYVSAEDDGELVMIDAATGKKTAAVPVGQEPEGVKTSPDGKLVFVTSEVANMVHAVDVAAGKVVKNIPVGKRPRRMAVTPDGAQLWVTNELDASVSVVSIKDLAVIATIKLTLKGARAEQITPVGVVITRDGKRAFVGMGNANHVAFIDVATRQQTDAVLVGKRAWHVSLNKAQSQVWVVNGLSDDVTVIDIASAKPIKSIPVGRVPYMALLVE
jgi:PQQ-dependent catabolism-associated beta-propeller protein